MNHVRVGHTSNTLQAMTPMTGRILHRKCACGQHTPCGDKCAKCSDKEKLNKLLQAKLQIGESNDRYEQEADHVAEQVMRMPKPRNNDVIGCLQLKPLVSRRVSNTQSGAAEVPSIVHDVLGSTGQPLDLSTRESMELRFGHDFSQVRVHFDGQAAESATAVNAMAYTVGKHVVFNTGRYAPRKSRGMRLLAHELTHVIQQDVDGGAVQQNEINQNVLQRQEPVTTTAATVSIGAIVGKCIIGAIIGALFDAAIQAALHIWRSGSWRFWRATYNYCSIILSAILGCIAAPISAFVLEGWVAARLGPRLSGMAGTLIGKVLLFIANKLAIGIPKGIVGKLAKLGCISPEQATELGVAQDEQVETNAT